MNRQVITIGPDGSLSGLLRKPGQGIDLRQFGRAEIERASEVKWSATNQKWYVTVLQEAGNGILTTTKWRVAGLMGAPEGCQDSIINPGTVYYFDEYDDAVKAEIAYLDALRLKGEF